MASEITGPSVQGTESIPDEGLPDTRKSINVTDGLIRLPDGAAYKITLTTSAGTKTLDPKKAKLSGEEKKLLKKVAKMLTRIQNEEKFTFKDLSKTKITNAGIVSDQQVTKQANTAATTTYTHENYKNKYIKIRDIAERILNPPSPASTPPASTPPASTPPASTPGNKTKTIANKLSKRNPLKKNQDVLDKIIATNNSTKEIFDEINKLEQPAHKDEAIRLLSNLALKKEFRLKLNLLKEGDLVCELSQGKIKEIDSQTIFTTKEAKSACGSICTEAIFMLAKGDKIDTEQKMYKVIKDGIQAHRERGYKERIVAFEDLINPHVKNPVSLKAYAPQGTKEKPLTDDIEKKRAENPLQHPFQGEVASGFTNEIKTLKNLSDTQGKTLYGVLTCKNHITMIYFDGGKPVLFDSAGNKYHDVDMGASILKFDTIDDLNKHLKNKYKEDRFFSMLMVGAKSGNKMS